jgi:hypothetical protein
MKTTLFATAFAVIGTPMLAEGLSFGGEANAEYNADAAAMAVIVTPEANYAMGAATFTLSSELSVYDSTATDSWTIADTLEKGHRPDLDFGVTYDLRDDLEVYAETGWDIDAEKRKDVTFGVTFSF